MESNLHTLWHIMIRIVLVLSFITVSGIFLWKRMWEKLDSKLLRMRCVCVCKTEKTNIAVDSPPARPHVGFNSFPQTALYFKQSQSEPNLQFKWHSNDTCWRWQKPRFLKKDCKVHWAHLLPLLTLCLCSGNNNDSVVRGHNDETSVWFLSNNLGFLCHPQLTSAVQSLFP